MSFLSQVEIGDGPPEDSSGNVPALFFDASSGVLSFRFGGSGWQPVGSQDEAKKKADKNAKDKADAEKAKADAKAAADKAAAKADKAS